MGGVNSQFNKAKMASTNIREDPVYAALRNDLILENVSSFLSFSDLRNFRLVNRIWNYASLPAIRNVTNELDLGELGEMLRRQLMSEGKLIEANSLELKNFHESYQLRIRGRNSCRSLIDVIRNSSQGFPCSKFSIGMGVSSYYYDQTLFKEFLVAISGFVTELAFLSGDSFEWKGVLNLQFSNLRKLQVFNVGKEEHHEKLKFLQHILENAPLIDTLDLLNCPEAENFGSLFKVLDVPQGQKIKNLYVDGNIDNDRLSKLASLQLKLQSLKWTIDRESEFSPENLQCFLATQCNSLKKLTIGCTDYSEGPTILFPCLQNVAYLRIGPSDMNYPELNYATQFPSLKHLDLSDLLFNLGSYFNSSMERSATVEMLELPEVIDNDDTEIIQEIGRIFPNVRKIKAGARTAPLEIFGEIMKNIEELTICDNFGDAQHLGDGEAQENMNTALTGYSKEERDIIQKLYDQYGELMTVEIKHPMPYLHGLKVLRIEYSNIGDCVLLLGIQKLRSLRCLDLRAVEDYQEGISDHVVQALREKFRVLLPPSKPIITTKVEEDAKEVHESSNGETKIKKNKKQKKSFVFDFVISIF